MVVAIVRSDTRTT